MLKFAKISLMDAGQEIRLGLHLLKSVFERAMNELTKP